MTPLRSLRAKLLAAFLGLALLAIGSTYLAASLSATATLRGTTIDRLTAVRETKRRAVEDFFGDLEERVLALSTDESSIAALEGFRAAWPMLPAVDAGDPRYDGLHAYYRDGFAPAVSAELSVEEVIGRWIPSDPRTRGLQHLFLSGNPYPVREKDLLVSPGDDSPYSAIHARYHPTFHRYQTSFGLYDIFLIDAADGRVLYTVQKEIDLGARLAEAPYESTGLARVYARALTLASGDGWVIEDYAPYVASHFAPAAFMAAPIRRGGATIGVLAVQVSIERVNRVMTGDRAWEREGFGRTGHAYIVGADRTLRSDMRFEIEDPDTFFARIANAGVSPAAIARTRRDGTAILNLSLSPQLASAVFDTPEGTGLGEDLRGVEVLRSHAPLRTSGVHWVLVAEMEAEEAFAPIAALRQRFLLAGLAIALVCVAVAWGLARSVTEPVTALARGTERLAERDFDVRLDVQSTDEVGQLAKSFNAMAERLQATTVSRDDLDRANRELQVKRRELEHLAGRLMSAQEEERRKLARELHDDLTQRIAAVAITAGSLKRLPDTDAARWRDGLRNIQDQLARISTDIHGLSRRLHSAMLDDLGLIAAIENECRGFFELGGAPVAFTHPADLPPLSGDTSLALYRIVQEALRNIYKHAEAGEVQVTLAHDAVHVTLRIDDNGRGFDRQAPGWRPGLGLASMDERARLVGGTLKIASAPGEGTSLLIVVPVRSAAS